MIRGSSCLFFVVAIVACSGSTESATISPEAACDDAANAYCGKLDECAPFFTKIGFGDKATCVARLKINCVPSFSANGTSATPARLSQCATEAKAMSCDDILARKQPPSCVTLPGQLADGAACGVDAQCKGLLCRQNTSGTCGACSTIGAAGGTCARDEDCDQNLVCVSGKCAAFATAGAACSATQPCERALTCSGGVCSVPLAAGAACTPSTDSSQNPCNGLAGYFCHGKNKVCTLVATAGAGAACGLTNDTITICTAGATCKTAAGSATGTCEAAAADGAACDDTKGPKCLAPARCVSGVCTITDPATCK